MDTARLETSRFKKCCENCITVPGTTLVLNSRVLLMYADTVKDLPVPEFIDPELGTKTSIFVKTSPKSIETNSLSHKRANRAESRLSLSDRKSMHFYYVFY